MAKIELTVIIINWNTKELLGQCLRALYSAIPDAITPEVVLVDNGSMDGSVPMVRQDFPDVKVIANSDNLGFAAANNKAIKNTEGSYILFLNTDVILKNGDIDGLVDFMDKNSRCGLCTPALIRSNGSWQESYVSFPSLVTELFGRFNFKKFQEPHKVQSIRGACMMAKRDVLEKIGNFNEKYFFFLEETDLCQRLFNKGYEVWYVPMVSVGHIGGGTVVKNPAGARIEFWKSRYIFFRGNYTFAKYVVLNIGLAVKLIIDWMLNFTACICTLFLNRKIKIKLKTYSNLVLWHILGRPGDWGINSGNMTKLDKFTVRSEYLSWWKENEKDLFEKGSKFQIIKENSSRKLSLFNNKVYVKIYKKSFSLKKPWKREWLLLNRIRQLDIPTIKPISVGPKCLVTEGIEGVKSLQDYVLENKNKLSFKAKIGIVRLLAELLKKLHKKGVYHGDLHAGNILVQDGVNGPKLFLTDLHRAKIKMCLSKRAMIKNLIELDKFFSIVVSGAMRLRLFKHYIAGSDFEKEYKTYARIIARKTEQACHKLWRKRDRLYFSKNKYGIKGKCEDIKYILNPRYREIDMPHIIKCINNESGEVIKNSGSSFVSSLKMPGMGDVVIKIYRQKRFINYVKDIFRKSRGFKSWRGSWSLVTRRIETPEPVMAGELRKCGIVKKSFFISKALPFAENLTLFVKDADKKARTNLIKQFGPFIKKIHDRGIFPKDMKGSNILVEDSGEKYYLIDLDHIEIKNRVAINDRLINVRQIKKSTDIVFGDTLGIKNILIVKPSSFGDIIQSLQVASILKKNFGGSRITWLVNNIYADFLKMVPDIDDIIPFSRNRWGSLTRLPTTIIEIIGFIKSIRRRHFDLVMDLQGLFRSGVITGLSGSPLRVGFRNARECAFLFYNNKIILDPHIIHAQERYLALTSYLVSLTSLEDQKVSIPKETKKWSLDLLGKSNNIRILINPGGRWKTKRWPVDYYASLINDLKSRYNAEILLIGDKNDQKIAKVISDKTSVNINNLAGKTNLIELTALINDCSILITNDSGPMHLADFLGKPVIALFGPTDSGKTGPQGKNSRVIRTNVSCSPCFKRKCKNFICMDKIDVKNVLDAIEDIVQKTMNLDYSH